MARWVTVARLGQLLPGTGTILYVRNRRIALFNVDGEYFAIDDLCSHDYASLGEGELCGDEVECPLHGARFCVRTGAALTSPAVYPVETYPLRVEGEDIQVRVEG